MGPLVVLRFLSKVYTVYSSDFLPNIISFLLLPVLILPNWPRKLVMLGWINPLNAEIK